jgi:hypothetical protein
MPYTFRLLCSLPFAQLINRTWQDSFGQCDALSPFPDQELEGHGREAIEGKEAEAMEEKGVAAAGVNRSPDNRGYLSSRFDNNSRLISHSRVFFFLQQNSISRLISRRNDQQSQVTLFCCERKKIYHD